MTDYTDPLAPYYTDPDDQTEPLSPGDWQEQTVEPEPVAADQPTDTAPRPRARKQTGSGPGRRTVEKVLAVADADQQTRATTAALLGVADPEDTVGLAAAVLSATKKSGEPVADLLRIAELAHADPFNAVSEANVLAEKPSKFKIMWRVLGTVSDGLSKTPPSAVSQAGPALAKACSKLSDEEIGGLRGPLELIG